MKKRQSTSRKHIPQKFYSQFLSSQRLRKVQSLLKPPGKGDKENPEAILVILGIDGRYNEGSRELANYLFFGFFTLRQFELERDGIEDEDIEDVVLLVTHNTVHVYCNMVLYEYLLPYVAHWRGVRIHSLPFDVEEDDRDRDLEEEFKVQSLISMVDGIGFIGIPYMKSSQASSEEFGTLAIEKWPLIQSYAAEGFGKGVFFTMKHTVMNTRPRLIPIYNECDPVVLEKLVSTSFPLFKRHWLEAVGIIDAAAKTNAVEELTERQILEPIHCYFNHGRLMANRQRKSKGTDYFTVTEPFVIFGSKTQSYNSNPSSDDKSVKSLLQPTHMIFHCSSPKGPLSGTRTYFLKYDNAIAETKRNGDELCKLYKYCVEAASIAVKTYTSTLSTSIAMADATNHISKARTTLTYKPQCTIQAVDKTGRKLTVKDGIYYSNVKSIEISCSDIRDSKQCLGSVVFRDTFLDSYISFVNDDDVKTHNSTYNVLTSNIPVYLQWKVGKSPSQIAPSSEGGILIKDVDIWSNSSLFSSPYKVSLSFQQDKAIALDGVRCGNVVLQNPEKMFFYEGSSAGKIGVFIVQVNENLSGVLGVISPDMMSNIRVKSTGENNTNKCLIFYFCPSTQPYKTFHADVLHSPSVCSIETLDSVSTELANIYGEIQKVYKDMVKPSVYGARDADFMKHYNISSVIGCNAPPLSAAKALLPTTYAGKDPVSIEGKVCVTILMGLPCSRANELCNSLVTVNKEHVRWVVIRPKENSENRGNVDRNDLENQLSEAVSKKKVSRPSAASRKRLRIILLAVGFYDVCDIARCVTMHRDVNVREQMYVGSVSTCIWPRSLTVENNLTVPRLLDQCTVGFVNNVLFTMPQKEADDIKDPSMITAQTLVRHVNPKAAFIISVDGQLSRQNDFELVLNEKLFDSEVAVKDRQMISPDLNSVDFSQTTLKINSILLEFSQPLLKGSFQAHLRSLKSRSQTSVGCVYFITGCVAFVDDPSQLYDLTFSSLEGEIELIPRIVQTNMPTPPQNPNIKKKNLYSVKFYGTSLDRMKLMEWLRETGPQRPSKKCLKTKAHLTHSELNMLKELHKCEPLPEGYFYNGTQYVNMMDNQKTYDHPCMNRFIEEYLEKSNKEIRKYNDKLSAENYTDMFA